MDVKYMIYKKLILITIMLVIISGEIIGASKGTLRGKVIDKTTKQPVQFVNVYVIGTKTGAITDSLGEYTIKNLEENNYQLKYSFVGYISHIESEIRVIGDKTTTIKEIELSQSIISVDSVVVNAGYFSKDNYTPTTNFTYSSEEIRRSPGAAGDIFRAIETLPGVSSSGGEFSAFSVRGGSPRDNIVLIDNVPFDKFAHFDTGGSEEQESQGGRFSIFAPGIIEEANFQAGGFGAKYGGKNASFVDLKIKEGNKESATINGSYDLLGWEINYDGPIDSKGKNTLLISARNQDFKRILEITDQKDMGYPSFTDIIIKSASEITSKHKINLLAIYSPEKAERKVENVLETKDENYQPYIGILKETKYLVGLNWRYLTGLTSYLENTVYYKKTESDQIIGKVYIDMSRREKPTMETIKTRDNYILNNNSDNQFGWKVEFTFSPFKNSTLQIGNELYETRYDYSKFQRGNDTSFVYDRNDYREDRTKYYMIYDPQYFNTSSSGSKLNANSFADLKYNISGQMVVMAGIRYEYNGFNRMSNISPRISLSYQISERTKLNIATGVYYQTPELRIISLNSANENLKNEKAIHFILGITTYLNDNLKFTTEIYRKELSDIVTRPDRGRLTFNNSGTGYSQGIDIGLVRKFSDGWYGQVNYSYSLSKRNNNDRYGEYDSDFSQPHIFNILIGYELNNEWSFSAKWKYSTGRPKDTYIVHENIFNDKNNFRYSKEIVGNNDARLNDYQSLNVRIDYRHQFGKIALVTFLDVLNVYNRLNVNDEQFIEYTGKIKESGFGIIPTLGIKLEL